MAIEIAYPGVEPFYNLTAHDKPSKNDLRIAAQNYIGAFSSWTNPDSDDQTEFGGAVHHLGIVAARNGHHHLFEESVRVAPAYDAEPFGFPCHLCTQEEAISFMSKCVMAENDLTLRLEKEQFEACDGVPMRQGYAHALFWDRQARIQLGSKASIARVHAWCVSRRDQFPWILPDKTDTFRKYASEAKRLIKEAQQNRGLSALPDQERLAYVRQGG